MQGDFTLAWMYTSWYDSCDLVFAELSLSGSSIKYFGKCIITVTVLLEYLDCVFSILYGCLLFYKSLLFDDLILQSLHRGSFLSLIHFLSNFQHISPYRKMKWTLFAVLFAQSYRPKTCLVALTSAFLSKDWFSHCVNSSAMLVNPHLLTGNNLFTKVESFCWILSSLMSPLMVKNAAVSYWPDAVLFLLILDLSSHQVNKIISLIELVMLYCLSQLHLIICPKTSPQLTIPFVTNLWAYSTLFWTSCQFNIYVGFCWFS